MADLRMANSLGVSALINLESLSFEEYDRIKASAIRHPQIRHLLPPFLF